MKRYHVTWDIDLHADSPEAAAREALRIQRNPESIATVFTVIPEDGDPQQIDLAAIDEEHEGC